ncbi:MAG: hypothetical protein HY983_03615 [Candidatus Magasanikbacteria bacterium]|nr:hypothetical protein [Candidatus Magasanikbacteria bacterium]
MSHKLLFFSALALVATLGAGCVGFSGSSAPAGPMGVFRSTDKGDSWAQSNVFPTTKGVKSLAGVKVYRIFTDPSDPNALYLATRGQGLYYSYDKGDSWQMAAAMQGRYIYALAVDPTDKCTVLVSDGANIFKTTDCSRTWKTVYTEQRGQRIVALGFDYGKHTTVYTALFGGQILQSLNTGDSWRVIKTFKYNLQWLATDPLTPGRIYVAGADSGFTRSDDGGQTWISLSRGLQSFNDSLYFYRLVLHPSKKDTLYWISKYGILYSEDAGNIWTDVKLLSPPGSVNIYSFAVNPSNPKEMYYVGTVLGEGANSRSTFYKTTDGGNNWVTKKLPTNTIPVSMVIHPTETDTLFMGFTVPDSK